MQAVPEGFHHRPKGVAIVTDIDDGTKADVDLPAPSKAGAIEVRRGEDGKPHESGQADDEDADDFSRTGWAPRFGWPTESAHEGESMLDHTTWVESQIPEQFFGGKLTIADYGELDWGLTPNIMQTGTTTRLSLPLPAWPPGW